MKTITIEHRPFQTDIITLVMVIDHNGNSTASRFETDEEANIYVSNLPSDYTIKDLRKDK